MAETTKGLLTHSRLAAWRKCPRYHAFRYIEGWRSTRTSEALRIGALIHIGLEAWWKNPEGYMEAALAAVAGKAYDEFEQATVEEMLYGYNRRWADARAEYEVLGVEVQGTAPLLNPETWRPSRTWELGGKIDLIIRHKPTGRVAIGEHKSTSSPIDDDAADYWATLSLDSQISEYVILAECMAHKVTDILYDVLRKPQIRPLLATPPENRKYKADGSLYANQRDRDETPGEYRDRLHEVLQDPKYLARRMIPRTDDQIHDFLFDAIMQGQAMRESERLKRYPKNPDNCFKWGSPCEFFGCCSTGSSPDAFPADFVKNAIVNPELEV